MTDDLKQQHDSGSQEGDRRRKLGSVLATIVVLVTATVAALYWQPLTSPYTGAGKELLVRPVASAIRIAIVFSVFASIAFLLATLIAGKLPKKIGRREIQFDEAPSDEALATESLHSRVSQLEDSQTASTSAIEEVASGSQSLEERVASLEDSLKDVINVAEADEDSPRKA